MRRCAAAGPGGRRRPTTRGARAVRATTRAGTPRASPRRAGSPRSRRRELVPHLLGDHVARPRGGGAGAARPGFLPVPTAQRRLLPDKVAAMLAERPWEGLPPELAPAMRPGLGALAEEMIDAIRAAVPAYARPLEGAFGEGVRSGVEGALSQFLDVVEEGHAGPLPARELYADLGRGEAREGRSLEALLAAYRIGARVAWRRAAERARELGMDDEVQALLAGAIFAYMDELSAGSAEGFPPERSAAAGELDRRRGALARLLVQSPPPDPAAVELAAREARVELPQTLAAAVWSEEDHAASRLPLGSLVVGAFALIPDPDAPGRRAEIARAFRSAAALGPTVPWRDAARSARRAGAAARRGRRAGVRRRPPDHAAARARPVADRRAGRAPARPARRRNAGPARAPAGDA